MTNYGGIEGSHLRQYIEQIERLEEEESLLDIYKHALGMTPLEQALEDAVNG